MLARRTAEVTVTLALVLALVPAPALGTAPDPQDSGAAEAATGAALLGLTAADRGSKIDTILHPLATVPTITDDPTTLTVELALEDGPLDQLQAGPAGTADAYKATLTPSFGNTSVSYSYEATWIESTESSVWPDRTVTEVTFEAKDPDRVRSEITPVLHDLSVTGGGLDDTQPRAVEVTEAFPEEPRFVVLADPQVGDPRSLGDGAEDSFDERSPYPFLTAADRTVGHGTQDSRWGSFQKAIQEINLLDPDLVLVAGDLAMGDEYATEYEDAYRLVNTIQAPTYMAMGNHDGYVPWGEDGYTFWREYFGPLNYSVDVGPDVHILSVNTYDWDEMDRMGVGPATSAWGGQIQDDQLAWAANDLADWRRDHPDGLVLAVGHHNPTWEQSRYRNASRGGVPFGEAADRADGVPVAEQVTRGVISFGTTGQAWAGENRLALRDVLRDADPGGKLLYFAGHTHRDRVARTVGPHGDVVSTTGPGGLPPGEEPDELHYRERNDTFRHDHTQDELRTMLRDWDEGPLFVDTTTTSSSTSQYFGWRLVNLTPHPGDTPGFELEHLGYDANASFLDDHTRNPDLWNHEHADLGLFSTPSYRLDVDVDGPNDGTADEVEVTVDSRLDEAYDMVIPLSLQGFSYTLLEGENVVWHRTDGRTQDLGVAVTVPPNGHASAHVRAVS